MCKNNQENSEEGRVWEQFISMKFYNVLWIYSH